MDAEPLSFGPRPPSCEYLRQMYTSPKQLRPGDKVAIVAPASPFKTDELVEGLDVMCELGLVPVMGPNVRRLKAVNVHAAPLNDRVDELMWAFSDPEIRGIVVATGGCGSAALLPHLDYRLIAASSKVLLGMSDITALNTGILAHAGLISINGQSPNIRLDKGTRLRQADTESFRSTLELLMSSRPWCARPLSINQYMPRTLSPGRAQGTIVGGNCDTFSRLLGTPYMPNLAGTILFVEDVHKDGEALAREFLHMRLAGVFDQVAGIVIGEFVDVGAKHDDKDPGTEDVLIEYFSNGPPCVYGYSFSHGPWTIPIPIGAQCSMDADTGEVSFAFTMGR